MYAPAQNTQTKNIQPGLTINTIQSNTVPKFLTSRNLSSPPIQNIPNNPLPYSLINTNPNNTQHPPIPHNQQNTNPFSTSHSSNILPKLRPQTSILAYTTIRTIHKLIRHTLNILQIHTTYFPILQLHQLTIQYLRLHYLNPQFRLQHLITHPRPFLNLSTHLMV